jgi:hypothetical protein
MAKSPKKKSAARKKQSPAVKKAATPAVKHPASKKAAVRRKSAAMAVTAAAGTFSGKIYTDPAQHRAYLETDSGSFALTTRADCDAEGFSQAYRNLAASDGQSVTLSGTTGDCGGPALHLS